MKKRKILALALLVAGTAFGLQSCLSDDDDNTNNGYTTYGVVTVKPGSEKLMLQISDATKLTATNMTKSPFSKEVRAFAYLSNIDLVNKTAYVNRLDSFLTKNAIDEYDKSVNYGDDPVEIVNSSETCAEDGYLTIRFRTYWGSNKNHNVNLVARTDINTPYVYEFFHNANGDTHQQVGDGIVAFRMPEACDAANDTITLTLRWKSFTKQSSGDSIKTATFKYVPRKD